MSHNNENFRFPGKWKWLSDSYQNDRVIEAVAGGGGDDNDDELFLWYGWPTKGV